MVKGSDEREAFVGTLFFVAKKRNERRTNMETKQEKQAKGEAKQDVIAYRKGCKAEGTGLSHYILMDRKTK
jgi:modified peptide precursor CbpA